MEKKKFENSEMGAAEENGIDNKKLEQRMYELMQVKNKKAYAEWKHFFEHEFIEESDIPPMQILLEIVRAYPLSGDVVRLIIDIMSVRAHKYQSSGVDDKAMLASEIVRYAQAQIPESSINPENQEIHSRKSRKGRIFPIGVVITLFIVLIVGVQFISSVVFGSQKRKVLEQAVEYLNDKYGDTGYTVEDLDVEDAYLYGDADEKLEAYYVFERGEYDRVIYAVSEKGKGEYICFDNLQEWEIKQALQDKMNQVIGKTEGRLFWNSSAGSDGAIEDGYFHEKYDGDFDSFIEKETTVRETAQKARTKRMSGSSTGKNGNCDYYLPDFTIETMQQRMMMEEIPKDEKLQEAVEQYAEKYQIQLRGMTLPNQYFTGKMQQAAWDNYLLSPKENIDSYYMEPAVPFLMLTGWYVGLPKEDAELLDVENGFYGMKTMEVGNGIYGVQDNVGKGVKLYSPSEMKDGFIKTEIPKSTQLSDKQRRKAVSIRWRGNRELEQRMHLAIDKKAYGISENGYQVFITKTNENEESTEELKVTSYQDGDADLKYGDVLDGEGYLFIEYSSFYEWSEAPDIITIVNP